MEDAIFAAEQEHLSEVYAKLQEIHDALVEELDTLHEGARQDLIDMSEEVRLEHGAADERMEMFAAIETLNSVIDAYNQFHDTNVQKLTRCLLLLNQPYFAKVSLVMRPGQPARDVYIGAAGMTDDRRRPIVVDWRSPVAQTYYSQQMGEVSYDVDGKTRTVELTLRRQYDIVRDVLKSYFDTNVAIEDSLLLNALKRHHSQKLQAITATIQREQNEVVRHADVPALLVRGIAGSGKTSVMLQRLAYLFYNERKTLSPSQVWLFSPNRVFEKYIDTVLPQMGEANPNVCTWDDFLEGLGLGGRNSGREGDPQALELLEERVKTATLDAKDLTGITVDGRQLLKPSQVKSSADAFAKFGLGARMTALTCDQLHQKLERRFAQMATDVELQEEMLALDVDAQVEVFGQTVDPEDEKDVERLTQQYAAHRFAAAHDAIDALAWLRLDRIGMRLLGTNALSAAELLYLRLLISGHGARDARYVLVDEVQDYTKVQLMALARYFQGAHFLLLGDEHQAIREGTATFDEARAIFERTHGEVAECQLLTSYRSSPEITQLFASLMDPDERAQLSSVHRAGVAPRVEAIASDRYVDELRAIARTAGEADGLTAFVSATREHAHWLSKQLGDAATSLGKEDALPGAGVVVLDLSLAKGLEFDHVVIPDADEATYPATDLARRRLYTAISRATHQVEVLARGALTPLLG